MEPSPRPEWQRALLAQKRAKAASLAGLLELYAARPGVRVLRAERVVVVELRQGEAAYGGGGAGAAELRAEEVRLYQPAEPGRVRRLRRQYEPEKLRMSEGERVPPRMHGAPPRKPTHTHSQNGQEEVPGAATHMRQSRAPPLEDSLRMRSTSPQASSRPSDREDDAPGAALRMCEGQLPPPNSLRMSDGQRCPPRMRGSPPSMDASSRQSNGEEDAPGAAPRMCRAPTSESSLRTWKAPSATPRMRKGRRGASLQKPMGASSQNGEAPGAALHMRGGQDDTRMPEAHRPAPQTLRVREEEAPGVARRMRGPQASGGAGRMRSHYVERIAANSFVVHPKGRRAIDPREGGARPGGAWAVAPGTTVPNASAWAPHATFPKRTAWPPAHDATLPKGSAWAVAPGTTVPKEGAWSDATVPKGSAWRAAHGSTVPKGSPGATVPKESTWPPSPGATVPKESAWPPSPGATVPKGSAWPPSPGATVPKESAWPHSPDATVPKECAWSDATVPKGSAWPPSPGATIPKKSAWPSPSATVPKDSAWLPSPGAIVPKESAWPPSPGATVPEDSAWPPPGTTVPKESAPGATVPKESAWLASHDATVPKESAWPPSHDATVPKESAWPPSPGAMTPKESAWPPSHDATVPKESAWPPSHDATVPKESAWPPSPGATVPKESAWPPSHDATVPKESAWPSSHDATVPKESAWPPSPGATVPKESAWPPSPGATVPKESAWPSSHDATVPNPSAWRATTPDGARSPAPNHAPGLRYVSQEETWEPCTTTPEETHGAIAVGTAAPPGARPRHDSRVTPCADRVPVTRIDGGAAVPLAPLGVLSPRLEGCDVAAWGPGFETNGEAEFPAPGRYPCAEEIEVIGGYLSPGRPCIRKGGARRRKKLKISFDDLHTMFEYPSENSLEGQEVEEEEEAEEEEEEEEEYASEVDQAPPLPAAKRAGPAGRKDAGFSSYASQGAEFEAGTVAMLTPAGAGARPDFGSEPALYF